MYIPKYYLTTDQPEMLAFMKQHSFATIISARDGLPVATHLPFIISENGSDILLTSHFAKANKHWMEIADQQLLIIFSEPHAYISPKHYDKITNVPTWNYFSVHAYGRGKLLTSDEECFKVLHATIDTFESDYRQQWDSLPEDFRMKMIKGIVAFEVTVTELQGKKKLSQNKTNEERQRIIETLSQSDDSNEREVAKYMKDEQEGLAADPK